MSGYHNHLTQLGVNLPDDRMDKTIPELFAMLKAAEVEIKKEHQVLMVNKTTSFKKKGKGKKGNFKKNIKQVAAHGKKPSLDLSLKL
ncbi:hypothetical protein T12_8600, partial [Trichinella patagoniensis]